MLCEPLQYNFFEIVAIFGDAASYIRLTCAPGKPILSTVGGVGEFVIIASRTVNGGLCSIADVGRYSHMATAAKFLEAYVTNTFANRTGEVADTSTLEIAFG